MSNDHLSTADWMAAVQAVANIFRGLPELQHLCGELARYKGFWEDYGDVPFSLAFNSKIALVGTELAEAVEAGRASTPLMDQHLPDLLNIQVEIADAIIRLLDLHWVMLQGQLKAKPLEDVIFAKLLYNASRPHKHGKQS